jgi:hypothetical protein
MIKVIILVLFWWVQISYDLRLLFYALPKLKLNLKLKSDAYKIAP